MIDSDVPAALTAVIVMGVGVLVVTVLVEPIIDPVAGSILNVLDGKPVALNVVGLLVAVTLKRGELNVNTLLL